MTVLDTHAWVWWVSGSKALSKRAGEVIESGMADGSIHVSSISVWEVARLVQTGRLELTMEVEDWIARSEALPFLHFVPVDNGIALRSTRLPGSLHSDPADRIIIATALSLGARLVTKDKKLRNYPHAETVW
jgi:PIN domain nuclease of toxin-antitoxin system